MSEQDNQQEPTMEEILASIRRIISEDGEESDAGVEVADEVEEQPAPEPEPDAEPEPEEDSAPELEENEEIDQNAIDNMFDAPEAEPESEPEPEPEPEVEPEPEAEEPVEEAAEDDVFDLTDVVEEEAEPEPEPESAPEPIAAADPDAIVSNNAESDAGQSFADLSALMVAGYTGAGNTLEGLVREMLKPLLKAYLDENLPSIVKEMVEKEIARISRRN